MLPDWAVFTLLLMVGVSVVAQSDKPADDTGSGDQAKARPRIDSVDLLRGAVMVLMALDHARDYFSNTAFAFDPTNLERTNTALFLTRWVTHFCAPVFVFLAGTGAFLGAARGKSKRELSWFLISRGLWLILLEVTVIRFSWFANLNYQFTVLQVIWVLGCSMIILAGLIHLPLRAITTFGIVLIAGHNLLDPIAPESFGSFRWLWVLLHSPNVIEPVPGHILFPNYSLIPWVGVMAAGYGLGELLLLEPAKRRQWILRLGIMLTVGFVVIRALNVYGDPQPWAGQKNWWFTVLSFINTQKYPPSLLYLLMTLGPALILLAVMDRRLGRLWQPIVLFGRVPMFYYLLHLPLIHALAISIAFARYGREVVNFSPPDNIPPDFGYSLPIVYLAWISVVLMLYPLCRWFAGVKRRRRDWWLSYL